MDTLFSRMLYDSTLIAAWSKVQENDGCAGTDRVSIARFAENLLEQLHELRLQVRSGSYQPQPLLQVYIPKTDGKLRALAIPSIRDRVLQTAACMVLSPILEREFEDESFAYRPGRSVRMAVSRIQRLRDKGFRWVVDADIRSYFDEIDHDLMLQCLARYIPDQPFLALIQQWLDAPLQLQAGGTARIETGIPQGSPISPLLSNLFLDDFDEAITDNGHKLVRFADDFVILCRSEQQAQQALLLATTEANKLKLAIHPEKTRITNFEQGFCFLGVEFRGDHIRATDPDAASWLIHNPTSNENRPDTAMLENAIRRVQSPLQVARLEANVKNKQSAYRVPHITPATPQPLRPEASVPTIKAEVAESIPVEIEELAELSPLLRTLYLLEQGLTLSRQGERLVISRDAVDVSEIPVQKLDQLVVHGNSMVSTSALHLLAENGIGVYFADWRGQCWGALDAFDTRSTELNALQHGKAQDTNLTLGISRAIVAGKIANCRLVLRRYVRNHELVDAELRDLEQAAMQHDAESAQTLEAVRGHEGMAARIYFSALSDLLPEAWQFDKRTRQPPMDPVNAMLSYGYAVLFANIKTLIRRRGLDPHVGNLHALRDGHAALASDLMEEFRALVVDATVLQLIFKKSIKSEDFVLDDQAELPCRLSDAGRKILIHALEEKLNAPLTHPVNGQRSDWRRLMQSQVWHYARVLQGEDAMYQPCVMR